MRKIIISILLVISLLLCAGCQKAKSNKISDYSFKQAKQFVAVTEKFLEGDIDLETTKEKLNDLNRHFQYGEPEKNEDSTTFLFIGSDELIVISKLEDADNYDEDAVKEIKKQLSDIEKYIYQ